MKFGPQAGGEPHPGEGVGLLCVGVQGDAEGLRRHGHDELPVGTQTRPLGRLQVDADEQVVVPPAEGPGQVGVLDGVEEL